MLGCVLHATGEDFDVDAFLAQSSLRPYRVRHRSEGFTRSGLSVNVSDADGELSEEVNDAVRFLTDNEPELRRLQSFPGVIDLRLDFGYYRREVAAQFNYLPPELLVRAGDLSIGIELSLYHVAPEATV